MLNSDEFYCRSDTNEHFHNDTDHYDYFDKLRENFHNVALEETTLMSNSDNEQHQQFRPDYTIPKETIFLNTIQKILLHK